MPRKPRKKSFTNIYHVVIRGADRQLLFEETKDYLKFIDILQYYKEECHFKLYAYCLMSNHVHLLIDVGNVSISSIFRHINTQYAIWFNMKYNRTGFLLQGRFYSEPVEDIGYLFKAARYIHQNPLKAKLESQPGEAYRWSSIHDYANETSDLVDLDYLTDHMGGTQNFLNFQCVSCSDECLDVHNIRVRLPDDVAKEIIANETGCATTTDFQSLSMTDRNKYLILLHKKRISIRQLNRLTGIPIGVISRIIKNNKNA